VNISQLILIAESQIKKGHKYVGKGWIQFALREYHSVHGILFAISEGIDKGWLEFTKEDELAVIVLIDRLALAMAKLSALLGDGAQNPWESVEEELKAVIRDTLQDLHSLFTE